jgi:DNA uptake protein ComE-like DNA-binding protein
MRYFKLASLTAATLALGLLAASPSFAQATQPATGGKMAPAPKADSKMAPAPKAAAKTDAKAAQLDINTASADELAELKGIGKAYSAAIIKGRPYASSLDLRDRTIIPDAVYEAIKDRIVARPPR